MEENNRIIEMGEFTKSNINRFSERLKEKDKLLYIRFPDSIAIIDYLKLRIEMQRIRNDNLELLSQKQYGKSYYELIVKEKKIIVALMGNYIIERN